MGQAQPAQMDSKQNQSQNLIFSENKQNGTQQGSENLEFSQSHQINSFQIFQNINDSQGQQEESENTEYEILNEDNFENLWLAKTFQIVADKQFIYGRQVQFITQDVQLTVDNLINKIYYQFLTSPQFTESEKIQFLLKSFISISDFQVQNKLVIVSGVQIKKEKYFSVLKYILSQLITCILHPSVLKWQNVDEDPNIFYDVKNFKADIVFNLLFCLDNLGMEQNAIKLLFNYLEVQANETDSFKFIELMLKRELKLYKFFLFYDTILQLHSLTLLKILAKYEKLMERLLLDSWAYGKFDYVKSGNNFQYRTLFGALLSLSAFPNDGSNWKQYFSDDKYEMKVQMKIERSNVFTIMDELCILFETILNSNEKLRLKLFQLFSNIIKLNLNLEKQLNVDLQKQSSTQGLVFNLLYILTYLINQFINSQTKVKTFLKKIDMNLLSCCKKHSFFSPLYEKVDQLAPELTPFIEPEEIITEIDPFTTLFLLTQRLTHVVATYLDQFYISQVLKEIKSQPMQFVQMEKDCEIFKMKISYDVQILHPNSIQYIMQFLSFANQLALSLIDANLNPIYPYGLLSNTFFIDAQIFATIYSFEDEILNHLLELEKCFEFVAISMSNSKLIPNSYLRMRGVEIFQIIDEKKGSIMFMDVCQTWNKQPNLKLLFSSTNLRTYLINGIISSYLHSETLIYRNQQRQKLLIRYNICLLLRYLFQEHKDSYEKNLLIGFQSEQQKYILFSNYLINDLTFLTDWCLKYMRFTNIEIHKSLEYLQSQQFHRIRNKLIIKFKYLYENLNTLETLTSVYPEMFLIDEIREQLAHHLNYILEQINGKNSNKYKPNITCETIFVKPFIIQTLIKIYMNLNKSQQFLPDVVKDERCFSVELFKKTQKYLIKTIYDKQSFTNFQEFYDQLDEQIQRLKNFNLNQEEIPEDFLDPLCFSLMKDPVKLPHSNVIVDRLTIKKHLLSNPIDPFDRTPLKLEMVIEQKELKQKIEKFLQRNLDKQQNKQMLNQEQK